MNMTTTTTKTTTARQFRTKAEQMFRQANADCAATVEIEWTFTSRPYAGADGRTYRSGRFAVIAPGYRPRTMHVSHCLTTNEWAVR